MPRGVVNDTVQLALGNAVYASALRDMLLRAGACEVECVDSPDLNRQGVMVLDCERLERLPQPFAFPERVVLIARDDPSSRSRAWEAGVTSVVYDKDPLATAVLAVMAARLRVRKSRE
ncbi:MAG: hypothetical protein SFV54_16880 [Bryobacteraceae bacterium]|nr:hypothetical protein [Bryobacteraceae bacterium]